MVIPPNLIQLSPEAAIRALQLENLTTGGQGHREQQPETSAPIQLTGVYTCLLSYPKGRPFR